MQLIADNQAELNRKIYGKAPTIQEIESFLTEAGFNYAQYERLVGMREGTIVDAKIDYRPLPAKFWHLIYSRIIPAYGAFCGFKKPKTANRKNSRKQVYNINQNTGILQKLSGLKQ